jgi:hypothetical protein
MVICIPLDRSSAQAEAPIICNFGNGGKIMSNKL